MCELVLINICKVKKHPHTVLLSINNKGSCVCVFFPLRIMTIKLVRGIYVWYQAPGGFKSLLKHYVCSVAVRKLTSQL